MFRRSRNEAAPTATTAIPASNPEAVLNHAKDMDAEVFAFDIPNSLHVFSLPVERLALNTDEAWDLSVALVEELSARKEGQAGKPFVVLVNDQRNLVTNENPENPARYQEMLGNLQTVTSEGRSYGIHLMAV